jgi:hypothetical protein
VEREHPGLLLLAVLAVLAASHARVDSSDHSKCHTCLSKHHKVVRGGVLKSKLR